MPLSITCSCGHKFRVEREFSGKEGPCPACGQTIKFEGPEVPAFDVFISYSSKDQTIADAAVAVLERRGLRCWVAPRNIVAGKEWGESIIEGIEQSGLMVLIFSQHSNQSKQVVREVERAVAKGIPIIPFRIEDIPASKAMEYFISCNHWLDAFHPPLEKHLEKLADMAGHLRGSALPPRTESDDAQGLTGKLNAAVGTLLARDRRVRVLTSLAAVLVVAALIVAASVFATRDPVASAEVIRAKAQAEVLTKELHELDRGQRFAEKIAAVDKELNAAAALFSDKQFGKALAGYEKMLAEGQKVLDLDKARRESVAKRTGMETARSAAEAAKAPEIAKQDFENANEHARQAADSFELGYFASARDHWNNASAAYTASAEQAKAAGLPRLKAIALHTSLAVNYKWWLEKMRRQLGTGAPRFEIAGLPPPVAPGIRQFGPNFGSGIPSALSAPKIWPYQETISQAVTFLELEAKPHLGVDPELIDKLITTHDLEIVDATATKVMEQIIERHGEEVAMAYRLGTNVAKLRMLCALGQLASSGLPLYQPTLGDIFWSSDYIMHRTLVTGVDPQIIEEIKAIRRIFEESHDGLYHGGLSDGFAYTEMRGRMDKLYDAHFGTLEATTALFSKARPMADPPKFPCREQAVEDLIAELAKQNGWIHYDVERWDRPPVSLIFRFDEGPRIVDADSLLAKITELPHLRRLGVRDLPLEDRHLEQIAELKELRELWIGSEAITAEGMAHLAKIPQLEALWLYDTNASDDEIAPLVACQRLKQFGLSSENLGDGACATLAQIAALEQLYLRDTAVTDVGVERLKSLPALKTLDLSRAKLTDECAPHLGDLASMENLTLSETGLSDAAVPHLKKLTKLKELDVSGTNITRAGSDELKQALPMCDVRGN